jgi:hypothetical protein
VRSRAHPGVLGLTGLLVALLAAPARGEPHPSPGWEKRQANADLAEGQRLLKEGRYDDALFKLKAAYAVDPGVEALIGIAQAERGAGRTLDAYASYEALQRERASELLPEQRQEVERALGELGQKIGTLKLAVPADASCAIDGEPVPPEALGKPIRLLIGAHKVAITGPGGAATIRDVIIRRGKQSDLSLAASVAPVAAPPPARTVAPPPPQPVVPPPSPPPSPAPAAPVVPPPPPPRALPPPPAAPISRPAPVVAPAPPVAPPAPPAPRAPTPAPPPVAPPAASAAAPPPEIGIPADPEAPPAPPAPIPPDLMGEPTPPAPPPPPPAPPEEASPVRVGLMVGVLSFPRPVEAELAFKISRWFGLAIEGSFLPQLRTPGGEAQLDLKALQGLFRWYPFGGAFFLGGGLGFQNFIGSLGQTVDGGNLQVTADMSGAFFVPQAGWMWITDSGFTIGLTLGLQIPIPREPIVSSTFNGQPVPDMPTGYVSQTVIDQAQANESSVRSVAKVIMRYPLPEIDLLRLGFFF